MENKKSINTITYPIIIEEELWNTFKDMIPRTITINDGILEMIKEKVKNGKQKQ